MQASYNVELFTAYELRYMAIRTKDVAGRFQYAFEHRHSY